METLATKGEGIEMKNAMHWLISLFPLAEGIRDLEDRSTEIMKYEEQREKKKKENKQSSRETWDPTKVHQHIYSGSSRGRGERERSRKKKKLKEIMAEHLPV